MLWNTPVICGLNCRSSFRCTWVRTSSRAEPAGVRFSTTDRLSAADCSLVTSPAASNRFASSTAVLCRIRSRSASRPIFAAPSGLARMTSSA